MEEALIEGQESIVADEEATEVTQVSKGAFNFPSPTIAPQRAAILQSNPAAPAVWTNQFDPARGEPCAKALRVISAVTDQSAWAGARAPRSGAWHLHRSQGLLREDDLGGRGAKESASQRNTLAVCHHHPLRTFAAFGFTHAEPPFLALAKLPSRKTSSQLSLPCSSNSPSKRRHSVSHRSSSSQSRSRRQQVLALGYSLGRSRQRAPLRSTHKIPSNTARSSARGRPNRRGGGNKGSIFSHCLSLKSEVSRIPSLPHHFTLSYKHKISGHQINFLPHLCHF